MGLTHAVGNESHPITVHLMTRYGHRDAVNAQWQADLKDLVPVGAAPDRELAAQLGGAFEFCTVMDLADTPPYRGFLDALDPGFAEGFLDLAGFNQATRHDGPVSSFDSWCKEDRQAPPSSDQTDEFLNQAWLMATLHDDYGREVRERDRESLRRNLTMLYELLNPGRVGSTYLRPLWDAYLERGRSQLRSIGSMTVAEPEFVPEWARGDLILDSTLIDVKTSWDIRDQLDYCLNQLLGYVLLDGADSYALECVGIYIARYAVTITWSLSALLSELTGEVPVKLSQLRREFAEVCQPSIDEDFAWRRAWRTANQTRQP
jgi:hypothetical protein